MQWLWQWRYNKDESNSCTCDESELSCSAHIGISPAWVAQHIEGQFVPELHHRDWFLVDSWLEFYTTEKDESDLSFT